jgi:serine protease
MSLHGYLRGARLRSLAATVLLGTAAAFAQGQTGERAAHGLIIKLKESPGSESPREAALAVGAAQRSRLHRVMEDAGLPDVTRARLLPFGRSAQHIDFGRMLGPEEAAQLAKKLAGRPDVEWAVPSTRERRLLTPNDPGFPSPPTLPRAGSIGQWWLYPVSGSNGNVRVNRLRGVPGVQSAWDRNSGGPVAVAVLDTGIVNGHPDLAGRLLPGYDFVSDSVYANDGSGRDSDPSDPGDWVSEADKVSHPDHFNIPGAECLTEGSSWHGTDIAGLMVAATNNGSGVAAINWDGRVLPVRVAGKCGADPRDIVDGMRWAAGLAVSGVPINPNPVRIINISFGGTGDCGPYQATIDELAAIGVVVVAAAGNERGAVTRPAKCRGAIGVGAVNREGFKTNYSNFGPELTVTTVGGDPAGEGVWGPMLGDDGILGVDINGKIENLGAGVTGQTTPESAGFARLFGTSFSAPLVAGTVSLMLTVNSALSASQIITGLTVSARPHVTSSVIGTCSAQNVGRCICTPSTCGAGLLDTDQAVLYAQSLLGGGTYTPPNRSPANIDSDDVKAAAALGLDEGGSRPSPSPSPSPLPPDDGGGGGGGALDPAWLLALAIAALLIARAPRRRAR